MRCDKLHGVVDSEPEDVVLAEETSVCGLQHERLGKRVWGVVVRLFRL